MIAVDTNVVVRILTRDDEAQFQRALRCFSVDDVYLCETVILETEWVLRYAYSFSSEEIIRAFRLLLGLPNVRVSDVVRVSLALDWHEKGLDFADAIHLAGCQHAEDMLTFDRQFVSMSTGLGRCPVAEPPG